MTEPICKRIRVVVNPSARSGRGPRALKSSGLLNARYDGVQLEIVESRSGEHLREIVSVSQQEELHALALAGGDGTVTLALSRLDRPNRVPIGILPVGSGNDFANHIGIPSDLPQAFSVLLNGIVRKVDVAQAGPGGEPYCCVASVGLDELALKFIHGSWLPRSKALNILSSLRALAAYQPRPVRIAWQNGSFEGDIMFAAVTNTRSYGGGFTVTPAAKIDDGLLDLCIVQRTGRSRLISQFLRILDGTHGTMPEIIFGASPWVHIEGVREELPISLDGELSHFTTPSDLRCLPGGLNVLVPLSCIKETTDAG